MRAVLKKDIGSLKKGTEFQLVNGVFSAEGTCFTQDLVYGSPNFEVLEEESAASETASPALAFV